jgi:hypothetical protein
MHLLLLFDNYKYAKSQGLTLKNVAFSMKKLQNVCRNV